jgi:endonuclease/exonuclease/phosphatase family metal-dependent hydrolase
MTRNQYFRLIEGTSITLFFLQAVRVMFSVLFGIIYDGVFEGPFTTWLVISVVLLLVAFLSPVLITIRLRLNHLSLIAILTALARITLNINVAEIRYWGALITLLLGGLYLATALRYLRNYSALSIVLALGVDQFLRLLGHTYDLGLRTWWIPFQILWMLLLVAGGARLMKEVDDEERTNTRLGLLGGLALGGFLFMQTSLLSLPNAIARWSDARYEVITPLLLLITLAFLAPALSMRVTATMGSNKVLRLSIGILLVLGLMAGYFWSGFLAVLGLLVVHAVSIALLLYFLDAGTSSGYKTGLATALALVLLLILNFLNAFAFTYPYTLPALREMGWVVFLVAGIFTSLGAVRGTKGVSEEPVRLSELMLVPMVLMILVAVIFVWPKGVDDLSATGELRIATYNIHYGYDDDWHFTLEEIARTIEENDCDAVAMQEVDTGRMTSYGVDDAYYLAQRLKMNVVYLATVEHLTGIGVLYRGSSASETTELITSLQEQTGIIGVALGNQSKPLYAYGIWLGLSDEDTIRQTSEALDFIGNRNPSAFGGDFNAQYENPEAEAIREAGFIDPFMQLGIDPIPNTSPAIQPKKRIDYVWIRELTATQAWVSESMASDHRMVVVEVAYSP